ncbi:hypothetical protein BSM4216_3035 [Bacillus smithii]|nr:hypothetical protein BSM4216_3035 [Bacillus smithii]
MVEKNLSSKIGLKVLTLVGAGILVGLSIGKVYVFLTQSFSFISKTKCFLS